MVATNAHLMPFYLERGFTSSAVFPQTTQNDIEPPQIEFQSHGNAFWHDPGELLYTLALAYPYLDQPLQQSVREYMAAEMQRYPPLKDLSLSPRPWLTEGVAREPYGVPFRAELNVWPPPAASLWTLYGLWLWSKNTGDWSYAREHWDEIQALYMARRERLNFYSDIAGLIGYVRLAQELGKKPEAQEAQTRAVRALERGKDFRRFAEYARKMYPSSRAATGVNLPVFFGLTPEIGLFLREQTRGAALAELYRQEGTDRLTWWYLTRVGIHGESPESSFVLPSAAWSHFLAHAYIAGDDQQTLVKWLDRPWGLGDLYSIQKIVATLQAGARER